MCFGARSYANKLECGDVEAGMKGADHVIEGTFKVGGPHLPAWALLPVSRTSPLLAVLACRRIGLCIRSSLSSRPMY